MAAAKKIANSERLSRLESTMDTLIERIAKIEQVLLTVDQVSKKSDDMASKQTVLEIALDDKMKEVSAETDSKITASELRGQEKSRELGEKIGDAADKLLAIELSMKEVLEKMPKLDEGWSLVSSKRKQRALSNSEWPPLQSFSEKYKEKPKDTIVLVGDSLVRGVGEKLAYQSNMVSTICRPGARIETVTEEIMKLGDSEDRHLVIVVGTNNIQKEGSEEIIGKYKNMIKESKSRSNRKITLVGIPRRTDIYSFQNSRRLGVNLRVKELCTDMGVEFLEYEPEKSRLARDGLHLNNAGQDELGRKIFKHCRSFLV